MLKAEASRKGLGLILAMSVLAVLSGLPSRIAGGVESGIPMAARIDDAAEQFLDGTLVAGFSVAVSQGKERVFANAYGYSDLRHRSRAEVDTIYRTGSVGKQFTAATILQLENERHLSLDDEISQLLPEYPQFKGITVRQLLNHTAGLRELNGIPEFARSQGVGMTSEQVLKLIASQPREFDAGTKWSYSNSGYVVAGAVIEKLTGVPAAEFMVEGILRPLGLTHTSDCSLSSVRSQTAVGYDLQEDGGWHRAVRLGRPPAMTSARNINLEIVSSAGGFCSTPSDLLRWTDSLHQGDVLETDYVDQMVSVTTLPDGTRVPYGLGIQIRKFGSHTAVGHAGIIWGYNAVVAHFPNDDISVALMINTNLSEPDGMRLWASILAAVFGEAPGEWKEFYGGEVESPTPTSAAPSRSVPTSRAPNSAAPTSSVLSSSMPTSRAPTSAALTSRRPSSAAPTSATPTSAARMD